MKDITTVLISLVMGVCLIALGGGFVGLVWYTFPPQPPEVQVQTEYIERQVIVTQVVEVERVVTQIVQPTPLPPTQPAMIQMPTATPEPVLIACTNVAWVVSQPKSDLQAGAMKAGTIKRLRFRLRNEGTCTWDNYVLTSAGVLPDMPVPYTLPGEIAEIVYDFQVYRSLEARFVLQPPTISGLFGVMNAASPGVGEEPIYYRLDVYAGSTTIQIPSALGGGTISCGPGG